MNSYKIQPQYLWQLQKRKNVDPLFATRDPQCLKYMQQFRGVCLFFATHIEAIRFDLSPCYQYEVWILYSEDSYHNYSFELGRAIQFAGAKKVLIVPFSMASLIEGDV